MLGPNDSIVDAKEIQNFRGVFTHNTRRAAKMLVVDVDHPDIIEYINWKSEEEKKARALISAGYESDFNGEAYKTVSGQNGNNSIAVSHDFMKALENDTDWYTWWRRDKAKYIDENGNVVWDDLKKNCKPARTYKAQLVWNKMIDSSWKCADPAIHFNGTMNDWNTLAADGKINSTNPCLTGDTLVYIVENNEAKRIKIADIKESEIQVIAFDFEHQSIVQVKAKNLGITREQVEIFYVKTEEGSIRLTLDHEVMTNRGWVQAQNLKSGDKIYKIDHVESIFADRDSFNYPERKSQSIDVLENDRWLIKEVEVKTGFIEGGVEDVYDLNVPKHHCFFTEEMLVSNCSEYISLDDTACNLASINVLSLFDNKKKEFDVSGYKHAIRIWQMILEITNHMAQLPSELVAYNVWKYRSTGLGPANLGTLLMMMGLPYDSAEGRTIAAALMGIMTGHSYAVSAEMADALGPFYGYDNNRSHMLRVIQNHRSAAYGMSDDLEPKEKQELSKKVGEYNGLTIHPVPLRHLGLSFGQTSVLINEARRTWDEAVSLGGSFGYRNSQVTVAAPTGTLSFIMGCDSTGIEPCYALVTYKTLAGGGVMKIVNNSVKKALKNLGCYDAEQISSICEFIQENGHVKGSGLKEEHEFIFKCAASPLGEDGIISWEAHIKMLAALQSFVSGGISKTINMPESATHVDISDAWKMAYHLGCKGVSIYRDNCKMSAPLTASGKDQNISEDVIQRITDESIMQELVKRKSTNSINVQKLLDVLGITQHDVVEAKRDWGERKRPGDVLSGLRFRIKIGHAQGYVQIFVYPDGRICEFFLTFGNPGSSLNNMLECWSIAFSIALQRGESLQNLCSKYINVEFEPKGFTGRKDELRRVTSPVDYIARLMLMYFDDEGYIKDPSIFANIEKIENIDNKDVTEEGTTISGFEFSDSKDEKIDNMSGISQRPPCPKCGAMMSGGSDKCPVCPVCGYFGGCG